jgi:exopolyphosphatase / guanosine-5'-triphosphate,3'-diphosphate pyrophosphatase
MTSGPDPAERSATEHGIVPRWEWRTFGAPLESARAVLATLTPHTVQESDEVYILSVHSDASVKVRDNLMDVKHLERVNDAGLELWIPVIKAPFPLPADDVARVLTTLGVEVPATARDEYTLEDLDREVVHPNSDLRAVDVHKRRARYTIDDCMLEQTEVTIDDSTTISIAVESSDAALVSATVRKLGLSGRRNVCVARGLKALIGFGARRYAVIDVGTNSVKFHLGEQDRERRTLVDCAEVTRLGEGIAESGRLAPEAMQRTVDAIAAMVDEARSRGVVDIAAVGTAGLRIAPNRGELIEAVQNRCAITIEVISGEEEARLAYLAATTALPAVHGQLVVFDSGGGSSQFTFGHDEHVEERFSVDVGAVRVAERFGLSDAVPKETLDAALLAVARDLDRLDGRPKPDAVIAIGGTSTNLAAVKHGLEQYDADVVQGTVLDLAEIDRQIELYRTRRAADRRAIAGLQPARAEVILAGACIVRTILTTLHHEAMTVSDRGLRHGVVAERFSR